MEIKMCVFRLFMCYVHLQVIVFGQGNFFHHYKRNSKNYIWLTIRYHGYHGFASANFSKLLVLYDLQFIYLESQTIHHFFGT